MSPHATVFTKSDESGKKDGKKRLAVGVWNTRDLLPEEIGSRVHSEVVAAAVREAMQDAKIKDSSDIHFVQIKCPLLTSDRIKAAEERGKRVVTHDTLKSMAFSRGASALGIAMALGEVEDAKVSDSTICNDWNLYSNVASTSAGIELMNNEVVVMGNSSDSGSDFVIGHSTMQDSIDIDAVRSALKNVGIDADPCISRKDASRLVNVFAKAGAHPKGEVRGRRTTMLTDSDISSTRHARAVVNAIIAAVTGDPMVYVSGGSEHQGPPGGGPIAAIARL
jgi:cyanuric acid amidohydrolase